MGCQTWIYIKESDFTDKMLKKQREKAIKKVESNFVLSHNYESWKQRMLKIYSGYDEYDVSTMVSKNMYNTHYKKYVDLVNKLKNNTISFSELMTISGEISIEYKNNKYYTFEHPYYCLYRVSDYPDIIIDNKEKFIEYAQENKTAYTFNKDKKVTIADKEEFLNIIKDAADKLYKDFPDCIIDMG